jgi:hypothetical protein
MQWFALFAHALFTRAERTKVFSRFGDCLAKQSHDDAAAAILLAFNFHVEVDLAGDLFLGAAVVVPTISCKNDKK